MAADDPQHVDPAAVRDLLEHGEAVLVDVRDASAFAQAHPAGARNVPIDQLAERVGELPQDTTVIVSCGGGTRAHKGTALLRELGVDAQTMPAGLRGWRAAGLPVDGAAE
jgi:rhodanese-related sulfurtransferase